MSDNDTIGPLLRLAGPREPVPEEVEERVRACARAAWRSTLRRRGRRHIILGTTALAITAAVAFVAIRSRPVAPPPAVAHVEMTSGRGPLVTGARLAAGSLVTTAGERLAIHLSSGAGVRVDQDSRLRILDGVTVELLGGAVYVVSGAGAAVEVQTALGRVRDVGTRFEVRMIGAKVRVRVREGHAYLVSGHRRHDVTVGEEILAFPTGDPQRRRIAAAGPEWDWTAEVAPPFQVEGRTLGEFLAWFSAETGRRVRFRDEALARHAERIVLRGSVSDFSPDEAMDAILPAVGLTARRSDEDVELLRESRR